MSLNGFLLKQPFIVKVRNFYRTNIEYRFIDGVINDEKDIGYN